MRKKRGKMPHSPGIPSAPRNLEMTHSVPPYSSLLMRTINYTEQVRSNPSILAEDAANYQDKNYTNRVSMIFLAVAGITEIPFMSLKKFRISNMEKAFSKLSKEHRDEYKELCKYWGICPKEHRSKNHVQHVQVVSILNHIKRLTRWGYFDLFFPNLDEIIDLVNKKAQTTSTTMTPIEKAKYVQIFALFFTGHSFMPYDLSECLKYKQEFEKKGEKVDPFNLKESVLAALIKREKDESWNAGKLYHFYSRYMKDLPDGAINIDAIVYFMDLIDYEHKLLIKEFMNMLSTDMIDGESEATDFKTRYLVPISCNADIRALKEQMFPFGIWGSNLTLFMTNISEKERIAYRYAYNRFQKNGFDFGKNVESVKKPYSCRHPYSRTQYMMYGYQYAWSPISVRISDPNELWMMRMM